MNLRGAAALILGLFASGVSLPLASHEPSPDAAADATPAAQLAYANPTNLQVLSKDIPAAEIKALMNRYGEELGVRCGHCHVEDQQTHRLDYASDENPAKQTARLMMTMLSDINTKYLAQLGDPRYVARITCGNCHQGQTDPPTFESKVQR